MMIIIQKNWLFYSILFCFNWSFNYFKSWLVNLPNIMKYIAGFNNIAFLIWFREVVFYFKMCILFSYFSRSIKPNEFKFILLSNRDEFHHRLSKPASFINQNNLYGNPIRFVNFFCIRILNKPLWINKGIDLTPGKEGGTWLGLNRSGRISALLNLDRNEHGFEENKTGRGLTIF